MSRVTVTPPEGAPEAEPAPVPVKKSAKKETSNG